MPTIEKYELRKEVTEKVLRENGFRNNTFKCWIYKNIIQLIINVDIEEKTWNYDIYDTDANSSYIHFYNRGNKNLVVEEIDKKLEVIMNEFVRSKIFIKEKNHGK